MHEMGVMLNIVERAERHARTNGAKKVGSLTLQIGELSGVVPAYLERCWNHAVESTLLEGCNLVIETVDGVLKCNDCGNEFLGLENVKNDTSECPQCHSKHWQVISGRELTIKEIGIY